MKIARIRARLGLVLLGGLALAGFTSLGCEKGQPLTDDGSDLDASTPPTASDAQVPPGRRVALSGDLRVHTKLSFDALTPFFRRPDAFGLAPGAEPFVDDLLDLSIVRSAWQQIIDAAENHNQPGHFTTFVAYEYTTAGPADENLYRNVVFEGARVPDARFSSIDSRNPEDLWAWMDELREQGIESLGIPHNSNGSDGMMFEMATWDARPIDETYACLRMRNEPLVEVTQVKGTPETHPMLFPNDEWAGFELMEFKVATSFPIEAEGENAEPVYAPGVFHTWGASGLTGEWAEENTREAIYAAFRRKETFATSGPRIRLRFFAGYDWPDTLVNEKDAVACACDEGVAMGADLDGRDAAAPNFLVWAMRDPQTAPLERLPIVKGWVADGEARERVYDVACSDGLEVDASTHRCRANGATVRLEDCAISADKGAAELKAHWRDPEFDPTTRAVYYVRVLENPTCRWWTWDALRSGVEPRAGLAAIIRERARSSPIWVQPSPKIFESRSTPIGQ